MQRFQDKKNMIIRLKAFFRFNFGDFFYADDYSAVRTLEFLLQDCKFSML